MKEENEVIIGQMKKKVKSNKGWNLWSLRTWCALPLEAFMRKKETLSEVKEWLVMELVSSGKIRIERRIMKINSVMSYCAWDRQYESGQSSGTCYFTVPHSTRAPQEKIALPYFLWPLDKEKRVLMPASFMPMDSSNSEHCGHQCESLAE